MGINETGKIDFAKFVNNDNFKKAQVTKESKFVANVFGESVKARAIASKEINTDGKLSVAEKDLLQNAIKNGVIQGLSAKELSDLKDSDLEKFAQYIDELSNNKVPTETKNNIAGLADTNKTLEAKLEKLQAAMDSTTNAKNQEIKALNEKYTTQATELNNLQAAERKKAEVEKKQEVANNAMLNKTQNSFVDRDWTMKDLQKFKKITERFSRENINVSVNDGYDAYEGMKQPDFKISLVEAISNNPAVMKRLTKGNNNSVYIRGDLVVLVIENKRVLGYMENDTKIKDILKQLEVGPLE